jgi:hypothetical protein
LHLLTLVQPFQGNPFLLGERRKSGKDEEKKERNREQQMGALLYYLDKYYKRMEDYTISLHKKNKAGSSGSNPIQILENLRRVLDNSKPITRPPLVHSNSRIAKRLGDRFTHRRKHSQQFARPIFSEDELRENPQQNSTASPGPQPTPAIQLPSLPITPHSARTTHASVMLQMKPTFPPDSSLRGPDFDPSPAKVCDSIDSGFCQHDH